ncbi:acylphosphatase [Lapidilactobacillus achengensis]|uniref:acylphosphatase n=1 Tax=Lapidilactobacillus achengensis TaxID=2486000 RepID=A0ABW1UT16_9LACO|nr:acylphosphatase [Lapidilactobacillus achengensis]
MREGVAMTVRGRVQGVGFRWMTKMVADRLRIVGITRNNDDGSVYIEASGEAADLKEFIAAVRVSPTPSGRVDEVAVSAIEPAPALGKFRVVG